MHLAARFDEFGRPAWLAAMVLGFALWWPVGLAVLVYSWASGRLSSWRCGANGAGRWYASSSDGWSRRGGRSAPPSGNAAFDEYRAETLRRLEEEQKEFLEYLERLRKAKDKAEFDQFMADRRGRSTPPEPSADAA